MRFVTQITIANKQKKIKYFLKYYYINVNHGQ